MEESLEFHSNCFHIFKESYAVTGEASKITGENDRRVGERTKGL